MTGSALTAPRHVRGLLALALAAAATLAVARPAVAEEPVLVIDGRGFGHGVGMSQEGARTMAAAGASTDEILAQFYPGTTKGTAGGTVRVVVLESGSRSEVLGFPGGGEIRALPAGKQPAGFPIVVDPGGSVRVWRDGSGFRAVSTPPGGTAVGASIGSVRLIRADVGAASTVATLPMPITSTTTTTTSRPTTTTRPAATTTTTGATVAAEPAEPPPAVASLWAVPRAGATTVVTSRARRYRGALEVGPGPDGGIRLVDHVDVESYLRGMGEVLDPAWPRAALRAQAVAARTYALRAVATGVDLCDDDRCQVYLGQQAEYAAMDRAVADSKGEVLRFGGTLASTFYSANGGGVSATPEEGFGNDGGSYPYLRSAPYPSADPAPWTVRAVLADVGGRLGYPGHVSAVRVTSSGPSGRATEVTLDGDAGPVAVEGRSFESRLGLDSTLFALRVDTGVAPTLPDPPLDQPGAGVDVLDPPAPVDLGGAVPVAVGPALSPGMRRNVPGLLALLVADGAWMLARARRRARVTAGAGSSDGRRW